MPSIPDGLLRNFLQRCASELKESSVESPQSMEELRQFVLQQQQLCLERVVNQWNDKSSESSANSISGSDMVTVEDVQIALRTAASEASTTSQDLSTDVKILNEAAREALARLVLQSETLRETNESSSNRQLIASGRLPRTAIIEFSALCSAAVHSAVVQDHLRSGTPLFGSTGTDEETKNCGPNKTFQLPQERLEKIQRHFLRALGYDPDFGTAEIKRIFFTKQSEHCNDCELNQIFGKLLTAMNQVVKQASLHAQQEALEQFSDKDQGGVTRVVAVNYSEQVMGDEQQPENDMAAPKGESMSVHSEAQQRAELKMAQKAAAMQQEILGELLAMRDEQRDETLARAKERVDGFLQKVMKLPAGPERVAMLQAADPETQRYMVMHKVWEGVLASNGGKEPVIHYQR